MYGVSLELSFHTICLVWLLNEVLFIILLIETAIACRFWILLTTDGVDSSSWELVFNIFKSCRLVGELVYKYSLKSSNLVDKYNIYWYDYHLDKYYLFVRWPPKFKRRTLFKLGIFQPISLPAQFLLDLSSLRHGLACMHYIHNNFMFWNTNTGDIFLHYFNFKHLHVVMAKNS